MSDNPTIQWTLSSDEKWEDFQIIPTATRIEPKDHGTLFLYLDESGNFDFAKTGTPYFIMTCLVSRRPFKACHDLMDYKYDCFEQVLPLKNFMHAMIIEQQETQYIQLFQIIKTDMLRIQSM